MHKRAVGAVLAAFVLLAVAPGGVAHAIEPPPEVNVVCVDRKDIVYQAVDRSVCTKTETVFVLPQDRPFNVCAELHFGWWRKVTSPASCTSKERAQTVPDDGAIYVCSSNIQGGTSLPRGRLRRVDDPSICNRRDETPYVTPAAPSAVDDGFSISEDLLLDVPAKGVLINDKDLTGAPLTAKLVDATATGTLVLRGDGGFAYEPRGRFDHLDEGEKAFDPFRYIANDGALDSETATATVTVLGRNDEPVTRGDDYATDEDSVLRVQAPGVLANDSDAEGHPLTAVLVSDVVRGNLALAPDGSFAFDPGREFDSLADGESAIVSFRYLARDGTADSTVAQVTITVSGRNDAPVAGQDAYSTDENTLLRVAAPGVLRNDLDAEGQALRTELASPASGGELALAADGSLTFDPRTAFDSLGSGQTAFVTFAYRAVDSQGAKSAPVQVTIRVTGISPPSAVADSRSTDEDSPVAIDVLANDELRGGRISEVVALSGAVGDPDAQGVITYDPRSAFDDLQVGEARDGTFRYTLTNDEGSSTTTVRIAVDGRNDAPLARSDDDYIASEDATLTVPGPAGVLANDEDAEDDALTAVLVAPPSKGRLTLRPDGSFDFRPAGDLGDGAEETVGFTYRAADGRAESATTGVTIRVGGVNDPPVLDDQSLQVPENSPGGTPVGRIAFSDPDSGQAHTLDVLSGSGASAFTVDPATGAVTVADGAALDAEATPSLDLVVRVTDAGGLTDSGRVRIDITSVDEPPLPLDDVFSVVGNTELAAGGAAPEGAAFKSDARSVLANDADPESSALTVVPASGETSPAGPAGPHGRYAIAPDGSFTYHPPRGYTGDDAFDYVVDDGTAQRTATVRLTVEDLVWYVDNQAMPAGDGTSARPFDTFAPVAAASPDDADKAGDTIFAFTGTGLYAGQIALEGGQRLRGQGSGLVMGGTTLVAPRTAPLISSTGAAVSLATGNDLRGFDVAAVGGAGISGTEFGTLTAALINVSATGGPALALSGGRADASFGTLRSSDAPAAALDLTRVDGSLSAATVAFSGSGAPALRSTDNTAAITVAAGTIASPNGGVLVDGGSGRLDVGASIASTGGRSVQVDDTTAPSGGGCAVQIRGVVDDTGSGVSLGGNGGRVCFSGRLSLQTQAGDAFTALESPVSATNANNTIDTTTGTGLRLSGVSAADDGIRFRRISTNGAPSGIVVDRLSGSGGLAVTGTGSPDTGGIIRGSSGAGVAISDASNVTLGGVRVTQSQGDGIVLARTSTTTIKQSVVEDSGGYGLKGSSTRALNVINGTTIQRSAREGAHLTDVLGASSFAAGVLRASHGDAHLVVRNSTATAARPAAPADVLRLESMRYEETVTTFVDAESRGGGNLQVLVGTPTASTPSFMTGGQTGVRGRALDGARLDVDVTKVFRDLGSGDAVYLEAGGTAGGRDALLTFDVFDNNTDRGGRIYQPGGAAVRMIARTGGVVRGTVLNNAITQPFDGGILAFADGGRVEPEIGSNQITQPGCIEPGTLADRCAPTSASPPDCSAAPPLANGVTLMSRGGGTIAGAVRSNEIPNPRGGGVVTKALGASTVDLRLSGNRIQQSQSCSLQGADGFPILGRADGGTLKLGGGANTAILTTPRHAIVMDAVSGGNATVDLAGDVARAGDDGVLGRALGGSSLDIDVARLTRSDGRGHGVDLIARDPGSRLTFSVVDSAAAHGAGIRAPGGDGVHVDAGAGTAATGTIARNEIDAPGADGIDAAADAATADLTVSANRVTSAGSDGITVAGTTDAAYSRAAIQGNTVTDPLSDGIELLLDGDSSAVGNLGGNAVTQTATERLTGIPILARAVGGTLELTPTAAGNSVTLTDSPTEAPSDAIVVEALGGSQVVARFAGDRLTGGDDGLRATAVGSSLELGTTDLERSGGAGDGVRIRGSGALTFDVTRAAISGVGGDGIDVGDGTVVMDGSVGDSRIAGPANRGIAVTGVLGSVSIAGNAVSGAGQTPIAVSDAAGTSSRPLGLDVSGNDVAATGSTGDALGVTLHRSGTAAVNGNRVGGALGGHGIAVTSAAGDQRLAVASNEVQATSGPAAGIAVTAAGGRPCLDLRANVSDVPGQVGYLLTASSDFGLSGLLEDELIPDWAVRKNNVGTVDHTGSFSTCA